jgi:hypothetical protein
MLYIDESLFHQSFEYPMELGSADTKMIRLTVGEAQTTILIDRLFPTPDFYLRPTALLDKPLECPHGLATQ